MKTSFFDSDLSTTKHTIHIEHHKATNLKIEGIGSSLNREPSLVFQANNSQSNKSSISNNQRLSIFDTRPTEDSNSLSALMRKNYNQTPPQVIQAQPSKFSNIQLPLTISFPPKPELDFKQNSSNQSQERSRQTLDFTPNVFQKMKYLEDENMNLRTTIESKNNEIRHLTNKLDMEPHKAIKDLQNSKLEVEYLRKENADLQSRLNKGDRKSPNSANRFVSQEPDQNLLGRIKSLEEENKRLAKKYDDYKSIVNNTTFEDIEILTNRISGLETQLKETKRLNDRLTAQLSI